MRFLAFIVAFVLFVTIAVILFTSGTIAGVIMGGTIFTIIITVGVLALF